MIGTQNSTRRTPAEQRVLLKALGPYLAVAAPEAAPKGSRLLQLHETAVEARARCDECVARADQIRAKLREVDEIVATETEDFARLAGARAVQNEMLFALAEVAARSAKENETRETAERELENSWRQVVGARNLLDSLIRNGDDAHFRYESRGPHCWHALQRNLDPTPGPVPVGAGLFS